MAPITLTPDAVTDLIRPGMTIFVAGGPSEPTSLIEALRRRPEVCDQVRFLQPGLAHINQHDLSALHAHSRGLAFFITPPMAKSWTAGRIDFVPMHLSAVPDFLHHGVKIDLALLSVAKRAQGYNAGLNADYLDAVLAGADRLVAEVNEAMPALADAPRIDPQRLHAVVPVSHPLPTLPLPAGDAVSQAIAGHVAELVKDGDCVQTGVGAIPFAVLKALADKNDLGLHSGILDDGVMALIKQGVMTGAHKNLDPRKHVFAIALGSPALYDWAAGAPYLAPRPISYTHDPRRLAALDNFVSINGAIEVDLAGQLNAEMINGRQMAGTGGAADFMRAAAASRGGRSIVALSATAGKGKISRIVPKLAEGNYATALRSDIDMVVSEYGVARLRHLPMRQRAEALIEIAAPAFREQLRDFTKAQT